MRKRAMSERAMRAIIERERAIIERAMRESESDRRESDKIEGTRR